MRALLAPHFQVRHFRKGELLWREGETEGLLVAMRTGRVKIYRLLPNARSVTLFLFGPGHVFGFLPFIDGGPYPAYAQAIEDVAADVMPRSVLLRLLRADAELAPRLISLLGRRLREALHLIERLSTPRAPSRLAGGAPAPPPASPAPAAGAVGVAAWPPPRRAAAATMWSSSGWRRSTTSTRSSSLKTSHFRKTGCRAVRFATFFVRRTARSS